MQNMYLGRLEAKSFEYTKEDLIIPDLHLEGDLPTHSQKDEG